LSTPKRLLISGGSSFLGQHLLPHAQKRYQILSTFFSQNLSGLAGVGRQLDLRDEKAVNQLIQEWRPEAIIHLAGSDRSEDMSAVICQGAENITRAAQSVGARLIHLSSDVIFDGTDGPYLETEKPSPIHPYAEAKAAAEEIVQTYANHVIIRTSLIYSLEKMDYATKWLVSSLQAGKPVTLFEDQYRNPVWAESLALACLELVELDYQGTLNVAGDQVMNRAEFGLKMLDWWGVQERETLSFGPSPVTWPKDCRLDISLAKQKLTTPLPGLDAVISAQEPL
jgi:dTDP-4-dehydrorhamnose reductase